MAKSAAKKELHMQGELTIQNTTEIKKSLAKHLRSSGDIVLKLADVTEMDVAFLQMLFSAHLGKENIKKTILVSEDSREVFNNILKQSGYEQKLKAAYNVVIETAA